MGIGREGEEGRMTNEQVSMTKGRGKGTKAQRHRDWGLGGKAGRGQRSEARGQREREEREGA